MSKLARSFILINLSEIVFVLSGYFVHAYLARMLTPAEYGRYGLIITLATMTIVFIGDGIPKALSKYISEYPEKEKIIKRKAALAQTVLISAVSLIYYFSVPLIALFFKDDSLIPLLKISTLIIPAFAAASFYNNYFNGLHLFAKQALQASVRAITRVIFILVLAYFYGIEGGIVGYVVSPVIVFTFSFLIDQNRKKPITGDFPYQKIIRFGLGVIWFMVAYNLVINVDLFLIKRLLQDDYLVGIYNAVINVGRIPFYFFSQLAFLLLPTVSKMIAEKSKEEVRILIRSSLRYIIMLIVPTVAAIMIYAKPIIRLLYSQKYEVGSLSLEIFVLGVGALTVFFITTFILNGANKVRASAILAWTGLLINIALNLILIPKFSIVGSASATTVTSFSLMILSLYWVTRVFGSCFDYVSLLKSTAAAIIAAGIFAYLPKTIFSLFAGGAAYFIFYFIILSFLGELKTEDKENLKKIFIGSLTRKKQPQIESSD